jgi:predicted transcriptional regulator
MFKETNRLPDAELEIMKVIWELPAPISTLQIMDKLENKGWHISTVLKLISRLIERSFVKSEKDGRFNLYTPLVKEEEYLEMESASFLERLHGNSFQSLVAALYNAKSISKKDLDEIAKIIENGGKDDEGTR